MIKQIIERYRQATPEPFKSIKKVGLALIAGGGVLLSPIVAPLAIPVLATIGSYLIVSGTFTVAVASAVTGNEKTTEAETKEQIK